MRKTEKKIANQSYQKTPSEASQILPIQPISATNSPSTVTDKAAIARRNAISRTARRNKALAAFSLVELVERLGLKSAVGVRCPFCQAAEALVVDAERQTFRCTACKAKGGKLQLVKQAKRLRDWAAIGFLEQLAAGASADHANAAMPADQPGTPANVAKPVVSPATSATTAFLAPRQHSSFSAAEIERVKREVDLVQLIERAGVVLKKVGANFSGLCPFHQDGQTLSLSVTPGKGLWHCFGCQRGGSVLDWVMEWRQVNFLEAMQILAGEPSGLPVPPPTRTPTPPRGALVVAQSAEHQEWLRKVCDHYHATLLQNTVALGYLERRGLRDAAALAQFRLGFVDRSLHKILPTSRSQAGERVRQMLTEIS